TGSGDREGHCERPNCERPDCERAMSERAGADKASADEAGLQLRLSRLLLGCLIAAIASTIGVAVFGALTIGPRPDGGPGGLGPHPPPPAMPGLIVSVGFFVVAWVAVIAVIAR